MPRHRPRLRFPVILSIDVHDYQLFPGDVNLAEGAGIHYELLPGVTVIVGINGLGKTTLLNALFRTLSGPTDWKKRTLDKAAGATPITLGEWRTPYYFRYRVGDDATKATIRVTVAFGDTVMILTRRLQDLELVELSIDGRQTDASEQAYRSEACRLSGLQTFEDYFVVLRYLVFVLEDRRPIVWDADAQMDILRILFFDRDGARDARHLFDEIQRSDSRYRNIRVHANKLESDFDAAREAAAADPAIFAQFRAVRTKIEALESQKRALDQQLSEADEVRKNQRLRLQQARHTLEERRQAYAFAEQSHYAAVFPGIGATAEYVFVRAEGGCLVCGDRSGAAERHIANRVAHGRCPLCNSEPRAQEQGMPTTALSSALLPRLDREVTEATEDVIALEGSLSVAATEYDRVFAETLSVRDRLEQSRGDLDAHQIRLPPTADELAEMDAGLKELKSQMRHWARRQKQAERAFEGVLADGEHRVKAAVAQISERFSHFVRDFIAETCSIQYDTERRRIGQEGEFFDFPRFTVQLTSAVSPTLALPRRQSTDVSESQKEFIDLSFRMALMQVAAAGTPLMLVLETPEASLDSLFVARAGKLLGDFALETKGNRLLASSNLTKGDMIAALFGAIGPEGNTHGASKLRHHIKPGDRERRIIDLLHLAAPSAALRDNREQYERVLKEAVFPEWMNRQKPTARAKRGLRK